MDSLLHPARELTVLSIVSTPYNFYVLSKYRLVETYRILCNITDNDVNVTASAGKAAYLTVCIFLPYKTI